MRFSHVLLATCLLCTVPLQAEWIERGWCDVPLTPVYASASRIIAQETLGSATARLLLADGDGSDLFTQGFSSITLAPDVRSHTPLLKRAYLSADGRRFVASFGDTHGQQRPTLVVDVVSASLSPVEVGTRILMRSTFFTPPTAPALGLLSPSGKKVIALPASFDRLRHGVWLQAAQGTQSREVVARLLFQQRSESRPGIGHFQAEAEAMLVARGYVVTGGEMHNLGGQQVRVRYLNAPSRKAESKEAESAAQAAAVYIDDERWLCLLMLEARDKASLHATLAVILANSQPLPASALRPTPDDARRIVRLWGVEDRDGMLRVAFLDRHDSPVILREVPLRLEFVDGEGEALGSATECSNSWLLSGAGEGVRIPPKAQAIRVSIGTAQILHAELRKMNA